MIPPNDVCVCVLRQCLAQRCGGGMNEETRKPSLVPSRNQTQRDTRMTRGSEILINNSGIRAINRQCLIFKTLEGWSQLRWRTGGQPSSNGISQCSVLCVDWAALHHGAGRLSRLHAAVHLLCLQDHPAEDLHSRLAENETQTRPRERLSHVCRHTVIQCPPVCPTFYLEERLSASKAVFIYSKV